MTWWINLSRWKFDGCYVPYFILLDGSVCLENTLVFLLAGSIYPKRKFIFFIAG
jgi:hypothetical protein